MKSILGIDVGSVSISLAVVSSDRKIRHTAYLFHHGAVEETLKKALEDVNLSEVGAIAATTNAQERLLYSKVYNPQTALISAAEHFHGKPGSILVVGAEQYGLIRFDKSGNYKGFNSCSACAAGTGSFLDQQAKRLNFESVADLSSAAASNKGSLPEIATRCAVFAKTDLIHAQQDGYQVAEISDGLCKGLAKNIIDTVYDSQDLQEPLIFAGGVALNKSVAKHLSELTGITPLTTSYAPIYEALGAAFLYLEEKLPLESTYTSATHCLAKRPEEKSYGYPPLELNLCSYADFSAEESYLYHAHNNNSTVEVDIYKKISDPRVYLGIDIGSTSTKCALTDNEGQVLAGLYTRTSGNPITALQLLCEALRDIEKKSECTFEFLGAATTGSGRKFIGSLIKADQVIDEITAHARAAYHIDPEVDTIIEIGGQDSKFTTLKDGMVTSAVMNNVCAAGTGSFIEEQAQKLQCPLSEYSQRVMGIAAPAASDRCTVFMERDLNYYLNKGFSTSEILASVLHSVRDNYLLKVASEADIGKKILFQGATAKNKALVAAFEHKLQKNIVVSKFCHLTGAIGAALILIDQGTRASTFRGLDIYKEQIPVEQETCGLCNNCCKIKKISLQGETLGFGFLCGRDYSTQKYIARNHQAFHMIKDRRQAFTTKPNISDAHPKTINIPRGLYLAEDRHLWEYFFRSLNVKPCFTSPKSPIQQGKSVAQAEFCAPIAAFHGHVAELSSCNDPIFLPTYLDDSDDRQSAQTHQYCYYTQFAAALASKANGIDDKSLFINPLINNSPLATKIQLYKSLRLHYNFSYWQISSAYDAAKEYVEESQHKLRKIYQRESQNNESIQTVILGRPYLALESSMNKGIPEIFHNLDINCFYQDMIDYDEEDVSSIADLVKAFHWKYASNILKVAQAVANRKGVYPVLVTAFKCSPDSFMITHFKKIMELANKPYLILELDEHDSSIGYETRIEAAVNAFRNHYRNYSPPVKKASYPLQTVSRIGNKTLLLPLIDDYSSKFCEAVLIKNGIDARLVPVDQKAIAKGVSQNTGQCLPVNIILHSCLDYIQKEDLAPEECLIWTMDSMLACNIRMYPYFIKNSLKELGNGFENVEVYTGALSFADISLQAASEAYFAFMFGGMLRKLSCKIRPYEQNAGQTDKALSQASKIIYNAFLGSKPLEQASTRVVNLFKNIETREELRPKIAIFGDLYVRDNDIINGDIIKTIEQAGGEVIMTSMTDFAKMILGAYLKRWLWSGHIRNVIQTKALMSYVALWEKKYFPIFNKILEEDPNPPTLDHQDILSKYNLKIENSGETADNLIKTFALKEKFPDISLFVGLQPAFCCAGLITEALSSTIEEVTKTPVVNLTYEGTSNSVNQAVVPHILFLKKKLSNRCLHPLD
ncbi:MAG: acyl-CoA dehydratase activase [Chlamydiota bacterium]